MAQTKEQVRNSIKQHYNEVFYKNRMSFKGSGAYLTSLGGTGSVGTALSNNYNNSKGGDTPSIILMDGENKQEIYS